MANVYEIIQGISQVMANAHDGAKDEDGNPVKIGLKREEDVSIHDKRLIDGFSVKVQGNVLKLSYHGETTLQDVHDPNFEKEITDILDGCISFLKKEYKKITKNALQLKPLSEPKMIVQQTSRIRTWVEASRDYEVSNIESPGDSRSEIKKISNAAKVWMGMRDYQ